MKIKNLLISICVILAFPFYIKAATLFLIPQSEDVFKGDSFIVDLMVDTEGEEINAVEVRLKFPDNFLELPDFSKGNSVFSLWPEEPLVKNGEVSFSAGVPGGFIGNGLIGRINFFSKEIGNAKINFEGSSQVLLNDGSGTPAKLNFLEGNYEILEKPKDLPFISSSTHPDQNQWYKGTTLYLHWDLTKDAEYSYLLSLDPLATPDEIPDQPEGELIWMGDMEYPNLEDGIYYFTLKQKLSGKDWSPKISFRAMIDKTKPEEFKPEIAEIEGKQYLVFSTTDKISGVDHYEIERHYQRIALFRTVPTTKWETVKSPYLLGDQKLSKIFVKAVDKAGNEEISEIVPPPKPFPYWIIIPVVMGIIIIWWILKKIKTRKSK